MTTMTAYNNIVNNNNIFFTAATAASVLEVLLPSAKVFVHLEKKLIY